MPLGWNSLVKKMVAQLNELVVWSDVILPDELHFLEAGNGPWGWRLYVYHTGLGDLTDLKLYTARCLSFCYHLIMYMKSCIIGYCLSYYNFYAKNC